MQQNKYLDELNIPINKYGTNFMSDKDSRNEFWKIQQKNYGFDERETWCLEEVFIEWLYSHLKMFLEVTIIDLDFHKFYFEDKEYTQKEAINFIINKLEPVLVDIDNIENHTEDIQLATKMWAEILPTMWW